MGVAGTRILPPLDAAHFRDPTPPTIKRRLLVAAPPAAARARHAEDEDSAAAPCHGLAHPCWTTQAPLASDEDAQAHELEAGCEEAPQAVLLEATTEGGTAAADGTSTSQPRDGLDPLPGDVQLLVLRHAHWSARATCRAFCDGIDATRGALRLRWPRSSSSSHHPCTREQPHRPQALPWLPGTPGGGIAAVTGSIGSPAQQQLAAVLSRLPRLTTLQAQRCPRELLPALALPALTLLNLSAGWGSWGRYRDADLAALSACASLTSLDLTKCHGVAGVAWLPPRCPALQALSLDGCDDIVDVAPLATRDAPLQRLSLRGCAVRSLAPLAASPSCAASLVWLDISGCSFVHDLSPLASCTALQVLLAVALMQQLDFAPLAGCTSLSRVHVHSHWHEPMAGLPAWLPPGLQWAPLDLGPFFAVPSLRVLCLLGGLPVQVSGTLAAARAGQLRVCVGAEAEAEHRRVAECGAC